MLQHWKINTIWTTQKVMITKEFSNFLFLLLNFIFSFYFLFHLCTYGFWYFSFPWRLEISIFNLGRAFWVSYWVIINKESKKESCNGMERCNNELKFVRWNDPTKILWLYFHVTFNVRITFLKSVHCDFIEARVIEN